MQLNILKFIKTRLEEFDSKFEIREGTGFHQLFIKPVQFMLQPFRDEANEIRISQSILRIEKTTDVDSYDEEAVDSIVSNVYVERRAGSRASTVARTMLNNAVTREYPANGYTCTLKDGIILTNPEPFIITQSEMTENVDDGLYYYDIPVVATEDGEVSDPDNNAVVSCNDTEAIYVYNPSPILNGLPRETNTELLTRARKSIGERSLVATKGFSAVLFQNFPAIISEVQPIGLGDKEMMRDILFNAHVGGKVDGYIKTPKASKSSKDFVGLVIDKTRQAKSSKNLIMAGVLPVNLGNPSVDRSNDRAPIVREIKQSTIAKFVSTVDLSVPINLQDSQFIKIGNNGVSKTIRIAGVNPASTNRNEIINQINYAFGVNICTTMGKTIKLVSTIEGLNSSISISHPDYGGSALFKVFGLTQNTVINGDGPQTFIEGLHYNVNDEAGTVARVRGNFILTKQLTGQFIASSDRFLDSTPGVFALVEARDIITTEKYGDFRVMRKVSDNELVIDKTISSTEGDIVYEITRTGIKNNETVYCEYYYNPVSIDIGKLVTLDQYGRERGIRPGREEFTITDGPILRITQVEEIDPLTQESTGFVLRGYQGYGRGGFGRGSFGRGSGGDYHLIVNSPSERYSMFDESYLVFSAGMLGLSVRVAYEYVPEIEQIHDFVRSGAERVLDGDLLIKHFVPAYVSGTIKYKADPSYASIPTNSELTYLVQRYVESMKSGVALEYSDINQFILALIDPNNKFGCYIENYTLDAEVHHCDGSLSKFSGVSKLEIVAPNPFPIRTNRPLTPRITHWMAGDIILERI